MGHGGAGFATAACRQIGEEGDGELPGDVREGVAVEEKEGCPAMAVPKKI